MRVLIRKLASRKFLAAVAGFVAGLAMVFGLDEGIMTTVTGAVTALASAVTYIVTEGGVDAAAAGSTAAGSAASGSTALDAAVSGAASPGAVSSDGDDREAQ